MIHIAHITSTPTPQVQPDGTLLYGAWEADVFMDLQAARASGSPFDFAKKLVATQLSQSVLASELPLGFGLWTVEFFDWPVRNLGFPRGFQA